jgi:photosystem II stability/assembly factor-like uncharacterized protein
MKKITLLMLFLSFTQIGLPQFVTMPLNYPYDSTSYQSWWTSIVDANTVWVGTARRTLHQGYIAYSKAVKTTDSGNTWEFDSIPVPGDPWIQDLSAWDANTCYYLFTDGVTYGGAVWKTTNGGTTWSKKTTTQFTGGWGDFINAFSADTCIAVGDPTGGYFEVQLTYDGGNTWTRVPSSDIPAALTGETGTSATYCTVGNSIWFPTSKGRCFRSTDRGQHWTATLVVNAGILLCFTDTLNGIAFEPGVSTVFYKTTDGGSTWTNYPTNSKFSFWNMSRVPGIYGGYIATSYDTSKMSIYFTPDFFTTIIKIDSNITNASFINFKSPTIGWIGGSYYPYDNIHKFIGVLTSVAEKRKDNETMQIIPNPSNREALIKFSQKWISGNTILKIMDVTGKNVFEKNVDTSTGWIKIDASSYKSGVYFIEVISPNGITCQRWIVQH